ncbi:hypothetical protein SO802_017859 [Lithocarpus litseifolius]|uniref:Uncharacterized protein n=1 Tax=Lithocarpus litseifolius TaxID=425828 RepID=A0AAW2CJP1_9ROSI
MSSLEREPSAHLLEDEMEGELDEEIEGEREFVYLNPLACWGLKTVYTIIKDLDLDECSEHEMNTLGDSSLFYLMRAFVRMCALQIRCTTKEAVVKRLTTHLEEESDQLKKNKEGVKTLSQEVKALTEQVKKLEGATCWAEELTKANAILTVKMTSLHESVNRAKADIVEEYKDSQLFFNFLGSQCDEGF